MTTAADPRDASRPGGAPPSGRIRPLDAVGLGLFALYLAAAVPASLVQTVRHAGDDLHHLRQPNVEARARLFGADLVAGVERIRHALEPDEPYLLIDGGPPAEAAAVWIRYDLAPRRAMFFRDRRALDPTWLREHIPRAVRWVVVARGDRRSPLLYRRYQYFHPPEQTR